jgi:transposase
MYGEGMSIRSIAAATGLSYGTVQRYLTERLGELRPRGRPMDPEPSAEALRQRRCRQRKAEQG